MGGAGSLRTHWQRFSAGKYVQLAGRCWNTFLSDRVRALHRRFVAFIRKKCPECKGTFNWFPCFSNYGSVPEQYRSLSFPVLILFLET